jgi:hypothetical protein
MNRFILLGVVCAGCQSPRALVLDLGHAHDAAAVDSAVAPSDASPAVAAAASAGPARYLPGILHSPFTASILDGLSAALAATSGRKSVFAKIGDSITADTNFLDCYAGSDIMLDQYAALGPSRDFFNVTPADASSSSFNRTSLAAAAGQTAGWAIGGSPSPIDQEVAAITPAFAVVMFGTNETDSTLIHAFERNLTGVVDALLGHGVVPLVSTIPPRGDSATVDALVPEMNAVVRAVAQRRQIPYMDYWQTLVNLPQYGLSADGVNPAPYAGHPCWLTAAGLAEAMNQRNWITLTALDRVRRFLLEADSRPPPDPDPPSLAGSGTWDDPLVVDALPFIDVNDTSMSATSIANVYSCAPQNEGGPEIVYQVTLAAPTHLHMRVFEDPGVDVDLQWLSMPSASACLARADNDLDVMAPAGTYWLSIDSYVPSTTGVAKAGAYRLTMVAVN